MNKKDINEIISNTAYAKTGGSEEEKRCAEYIRSKCEEIGYNAYLEPFPVKKYEQKEARLLIDGKEIECKSFFGTKNGYQKAPVYYLTSTDDTSLKKVKDKIVLLDSGPDKKVFNGLIENGAKGFITYGGNMNYKDRDIANREIRFETDEKTLIPAVNIHVSDAFMIAQKKSCMAEIYNSYVSEDSVSYNIIADSDGDEKDKIVVSAHYDSTAFSCGSYDNMSGAVCLLALSEYFLSKPHKASVRFLWCGSEERGLVGSKEYLNAHEDEIDLTLLNINLDMLGSVMGGFVAFSCANEEMTKLLERFIKKHRFDASVRYAIRSSDSNSFVVRNIPAVSFARYAPNGTTPIHTRYDTPKAVSADRLMADAKFIAKFTEYMASLPEIRELRYISEKIRTDIDNYYK